MEWPESRRIASMYQSPGPAGIGFARYASSGTVTPEFWENINRTESEAARRPEDPAVESWAEDMTALRTALEEEGITEPLDRDELKELVRDALNADSNDEEHDALVHIADMVGLEYNNDTEEYQ